MKKISATKNNVWVSQMNRALILKPLFYRILEIQIKMSKGLDHFNIFCYGLMITFQLHDEIILKILMCLNILLKMMVVRKWNHQKLLTIGNNHSEVEVMTLHNKLPLERSESMLDCLCLRPICQLQSFFLPMCNLGDSRYYQITQVLAPHVRDRDGFLGSWLQPGSILSFRDIFWSKLADGSSPFLNVENHYVDNLLGFLSQGRTPVP